MLAERSPHWQQTVRSAVNANHGLWTKPLPLNQLRNGPPRNLGFCIAHDFLQQLVLGGLFCAEEPLHYPGSEPQQLRGHQPVQAGNSGQAGRPGKLSRTGKAGNQDYPR